MTEDKEKLKKCHIAVGTPGMTCTYSVISSVGLISGIEIKALEYLKYPHSKGK